MRNQRHHEMAHESGTASARRGLGAVAIAALLLAGCQTYNGPPEPEMIQPEGGAFNVGDAVALEFSNKIAPDTLELRLWVTERDVENEIPKDATPVAEGCTLKKPCDNIALELVDNGRKLEILFDGPFGVPGTPVVLEVLSGLEDREGNPTGVSYHFDIQFRDDSAGGEPVEFDDGVYILLAQIQDPLPAVLNLASDIQVIDDTGRFALVGVESDEINGAPNNTRDPENLAVDTTALGFVIHAYGQISNTDDGKRLLESDVFSVSIPLGPLTVELTDVRLFGELKVNPDTDKDMLDGTLSFGALKIFNGDRLTSDQGGGSTALIADWVPPELVPEGTPTICGDLCGAAGGLCEPPAEFPLPEFCE